MYTRQDYIDALMAPDEEFFKTLPDVYIGKGLIKDSFKNLKEEHCFLCRWHDGKIKKMFVKPAQGDWGFCNTPLTLLTKILREIEQCVSRAVKRQVEPSKLAVVFQALVDPRCGGDLTLYLVESCVLADGSLNTRDYVVFTVSLNEMEEAGLFECHISAAKNAEIEAEKERVQKRFLEEKNAEQRQAIKDFFNIETHPRNASWFSRLIASLRL